MTGQGARASRRVGRTGATLSVALAHAVVILIVCVCVCTHTHTHTHTHLIVWVDTEKAGGMQLQGELVAPAAVDRGARGAVRSASGQHASVQ